MDIRNEWKKSANFMLTIVVFCCFATAGFAYLYVKKPPFSNINNVVIIGSSLCFFAALFFLFRSLRRRPEQDAARTRGSVSLPL